MDDNSLDIDSCKDFVEKINLEYHRQVKRYELDFSNIDKMKYVEIDGEKIDLKWL